MEVKEKKKHRVLKTILGMIAGLILLFLAAVFFFGDEDDGYVPISEETELTALVQELSAGGPALAPDYGGDGGLWGVERTQDGLREPYTHTANAETVTMMVYMLGSNLESESGCATADLEEMLASGNGSALNIVVQTGGAEQWQNNWVSAQSRQRWLLQNGKHTLCDELPQGSMCTPESLTDFIAWSAENFPADRYLLVLWDHGGGTLGGFGYDENFPDDTLTLSQMASAVAQSGVKLDLISYDACLMATLEVGYAFAPSADYLLASEETEPGEGWYYTDALSALSENPAMPTVELGARLIDSYAGYYEAAYDTREVTLSLLDLREVPALYEACAAYYDHAEETLQTGQSGFTGLSAARSGARSYGEGEYEQIDLVDYVQRTGVTGGEELIRAAFSAVKYRNDSSLQGSYGTAVYFPYTNPEYYGDVMAELKSISYTEAESFYDQFLSVLTGSDAGNSGTSALTGWQNENEDYSTESWYDDTTAQNYDYQTLSDTDELVVNYSETYDAYLLTLSEDEWEAITDIQLQVYLDDGEGYIDLGSDQTYDWTDDGDLILDFDNTWVSIDGNLAAFYAAEPVEDGDNTLFTGKSPAILNGEQEIDLYLRWTQDAEGNSTAEVLGYVPTEDSGAVRPKGYLPLHSGDELQLLCDYYTYDGDYDASYYLGDPFTVTDQAALAVDWYDLEDATVLCWLRLTDWFQQDWYTETIEISYGA